MPSQPTTIKNTPYLGIAQTLPRWLSRCEDTVYAFPQHEILLNDEGQFVQTRSGPNWQGGVMTLTTCKHFLRQTRAPEDWVGVWFAGFAPKSATPGSNFLMYIARCGESYASNYDLGATLPKPTYRAKLATNNPVGDIFEPKRRLTGAARYRHENFVEPVGHVRQTENYKDGSPKWWRDLEYMRKRRPAALLMDAAYLFNRPVYRTTRELHRSGFKCSVAELVSLLEKST